MIVRPYSGHLQSVRYDAWQKSVEGVRIEALYLRVLNRCCTLCIPVHRTHSTAVAATSTSPIGLGITALVVGGRVAWDIRQVFGYAELNASRQRGAELHVNLEGFDNFHVGLRRTLWAPKTG